MKSTTKKTITKWFWIVLTFPFAALLFLLLLVWLFARIPSFEELENPDSKLATQVIAEDGETLTTFHIENRTFVTYEDLSEHLVHAAIATEDARFEKHSGIDMKGLGRVLFKTLLMHNSSQGGGSTITQQLVKNVYLTHEQTIRRKALESLIALYIEARSLLSKDEILELYLNLVEMGPRVYGIAAAAEYHFAKSATRLTVN